MLYRLACLISLLLVPLRAEDAALQKQVTELRDLVIKLQARVDQLEIRQAATRAPEPAGPVSAAAPVQAAAQAAAPAPSSNPLGGTTLNFGFDGYYGYNFNNPIGRVNLLRAYDVSSNAFSLNQASIVLENAPDVAAGKRWGARVDLQFGQATETLQGNPLNEPRPDILPVDLPGFMGLMCSLSERGSR